MMRVECWRGDRRRKVAEEERRCMVASLMKCGPEETLRLLSPLSGAP